MPRRLRFTGELPPQKYWKKYPNWSCALEEEGFEGQDESTLRPSRNQKIIDWEVDWTVIDVIFANGERTTGMANVLDGELNYICVYPSQKKDRSWVICFLGPRNRCVAVDKDWPAKNTNLPVPIGDRSVFPITITTRLRYKRKPIVLVVKKAYKQKKWNP